MLKDNTIIEGKCRSIEVDRKLGSNISYSKARLPGFSKALLRMIVPECEQGLPVRHTTTPSAAMVSTIGEDRSGEFSSSSRVNMRGDITV